jgi:hypothetical protein
MKFLVLSHLVGALARGLRRRRRRAQVDSREALGRPEGRGCPTLPLPLDRSEWRLTARRDEPAGSRLVRAGLYAHRCIPNTAAITLEVFARDVSPKAAGAPGRELVPIGGEAFLVLLVRQEDHRAVFDEALADLRQALKDAGDRVDTMEFWGF